MAERQLLVRIIGDDKDLQRAFASSERRAKSFDARLGGIGSGLGKAFAAAGIALGASAVFAATGRAIKAASDLNEEISKSRQIFGDSSRQIELWSETTSRSLGIAKGEALSATGTFGNLFSTVGLIPEQSAEMSTALVQLAADLASFNNADPSEVLIAIRSGLIGEAEPLRRYGVLLSEVRVGQAAMAATGKTNVKELTNQEKALARYNIILQDTVPAQGDFARTSGGLANQSRILRAQLSDLSAEFGENLLPVMIKAVGAANKLVVAFNALGQSASKPITIDVDNTSLQQLDVLREKIAGIRGETDFLVIALDEAIQLIKGAQAPRPDDRAGPRGPGAIAASNLKADEAKRLREQQQAKRELDQSRKRFATFIQGLGLKLDKTGLTKSLDDDLAVLREIERAILRQIGVEGRTFDLEQQLVDNRLKQAQIIGQRTTEVEKKEKEVVKKRGATATGKSAQQRRIERQFEALGLTGEGDQRTPGIAALKRRLGTIREQVEGTALDTDKTGSELDRIARVLAGRFGKVGKEVRSSILAMFNDISSALNEGGVKVGPLTKTSGLNTKKVLEGLGLSPEEINELRGRLSSFNTGGLTPAGAGRGATGGFTGGTGFVVESHTTINLDGQQVAAVVTRQQQKQRRRNPKQKRGPNRARNL